MKRLVRLDIVILLLLLLAICGGIGFLHASELQNNELWQQIQPLMLARNVKNTAKVIAQYPLAEQKNTLKHIISNTKLALSPEDKIGIIYNVLLLLPNAQDRTHLLQLLFENAHITKVPLLYIAVDYDHKTLIPLVLEAVSKDTEKQKLLASDALKYTLQHNDSDKGKKLLENMVKHTTIDTTSLLWEVINGKKNPEFITLLAIHGANPNDVRAGKPLLVAAVETNIPQLVKALLDAGAEINKIADPVIGSALQTASREKYTDVELLLRKHGASMNLVDDRKAMIQKTFKN